MQSFFFKKNFFPFFIAQSAGAFNDNFYKQALLLFIAYKLDFSQLPALFDVNLLNNLAAMALILPFFIFSVLAGQLGEKFPKHRIIQLVKLVELAIVIVGFIGFFKSDLLLLFVALFALGIHSTFLGPVKYAILPQVLRGDELLSGNSFLESGTFFAIILGTLLAGIILANQHYQFWLAICLLGFALLGCIASWFIPKQPATNPELRLKLNLFTQTYGLLKFALLKKNRYISYAIIACSWFWFVGVLYTTQIPNYVKNYLGGGELVTTFMLLCFSFGLAFGALLCSRLSRGYVEIALIPIGTAILTVFGFLLWLHTPDALVAVQYSSLWEIFSSPQHLLVAVDLAVIGAGGGLYFVPANVLIQIKSSDADRSRIISANYIVNSVFMVLAAGFAILILNLFQFSIPSLFLIVALLNVVVMLGIFKLTPDYLVRFLAWVVSNLVYRIRVVGEEHIPQSGSAVLVCNHVSFIDSLLLSAVIKQPIRFVAYFRYYEMPIIGHLMQAMRSIPIAGASENKDLRNAAFRKIHRNLLRDNFVCIFPEGGLTKDGEIAPFRPGIERIIEETPVPVVPLAIQGLWQSYFSRNPKRHWFKLKRTTLTVHIGEPIPAEQVTKEYLFQQVKQLRGDYR